jgi:hypothetical protein
MKKMSHLNLIMTMTIRLDSNFVAQSLVIIFRKTILSMALWALSTPETTKSCY